MGGCYFSEGEGKEVGRVEGTVGVLSFSEGKTGHPSTCKTTPSGIRNPSLHKASPAGPRALQAPLRQARHGLRKGTVAEAQKGPRWSCLVVKGVKEGGTPLYLVKSRDQGLRIGGTFFFTPRLMGEVSPLPTGAHWPNSRKTCPHLYPPKEGSHIYSWNVGHPSPCSLPSPPPGYFSHLLVQPGLRAD